LACAEVVFKHVPQVTIMKTRLLVLSAVIALAANGFAAAQTAMTDEAQMTLYTFDKDSEGMSNCYDSCAQNWPPYLVKDGVTKGAGWTKIDRTDGSKQWAYKGKPVYFYRADTKAGDVTGDGKGGGTWHILTQ